MFDDEEEDGEEPSYSREDYEADRADRLLKEMKIDGSYWSWRKSGLSYAEWQRLELEAAYERDKRLFGGS